MEVKPRTKAEQAETTRRALLAAARDLFARNGFEATPAEEIVSRAGVTRGAMYHHFRDKRDLFAAVFEQIQGENAAAVVAAATGPSDPREQLLAGIDAFLDACLDPAVQRISLLDGPSVLGWERWREIESRYGLALLRGAVQQAIESGLVAEQPVEPLAHLLLGALQEAGLHIAASDDRPAARDEMRAAFQRLLDGLGRA